MSKTFLTCSFFKMATDEKPFFTKFCGKGACGRQKIAVNDALEMSCLGDYEPTEEWLQCPMCKVGSIPTISLIENRQ